MAEGCPGCQCSLNDQVFAHNNPSAELLIAYHEGGRVRPARQWKSRNARHFGSKMVMLANPFGFSTAGCISVMNAFQIGRQSGTLSGNDFGVQSSIRTRNYQGADSAVVT
jgi:hypothetical protein